MVDPTSDLGEDVDESNASTCATCGEAIVQLPTHHVVTWIEDGTAQHRHFCSETCHTEFESNSNSNSNSNSEN
ncbi:DUF7576 family protein [Haloquadratum walsbyi]|uniref:Small CPxCG-related zinc finger protein n=1 Tax=Haloquadratum walsbyi (strain DSM 16790 / HBSQ001) TaxID=362976 RepID=Q18HS1_HALWD|nr:hypothetical protein [Haloquadratum walsbyi]CAJ52464.1 small CPxCG-related zinc finger protein [Haloquadratum walsbyi DSM 16790]